MTDALWGPDGTWAPDSPDALAAPPAGADALAAPLPDAEALASVRAALTSPPGDQPAPPARPAVPTPPVRRVPRPVLGFDEDDAATTLGSVARLREERRRHALLQAERARDVAPGPGSGIRATTVIAVLVVVALVVVVVLAG